MHNCEPKPAEEDTPTQPPVADFKVEEIVSPPDPPIEVSEPIPVVMPVEQPSLPPVLSKKIVMFWCLPFEIKYAEDDLYGDQYAIPGYGKKFTFEGIIISKNDLEMTFWTNVSHLSEKSIVFPTRYVFKNESYNEFRWWKIQEIIPKGPGWAMRCVISDITPDFSN